MIRKIWKLKYFFNDAVFERNFQTEKELREFVNVTNYEALDEGAFAVCCVEEIVTTTCNVSDFYTV